MLLKAAELLAAAGELPVNLRFACDGEEEIGGHSIVDWIASDERGEDAAIVFDSGMVERDVPGFNIAVRGLCYFHVAVRTGSRDLHSGMYGGASLNAMHALMQTLSAVLPRDGRLPAELRVGIVPPSEAEQAGWAILPAGAAEIAAAGSMPADAAAGDEFYLRTWAEPSVDVHGIQGGSPVLQKTVIAVAAEANVSIRLVGDQDPTVIVPAFEALLREAAPEGTDARRNAPVGGTARPDSPGRRCGRPRSRRLRGGARRPPPADSLRWGDPARLRPCGARGRDHSHRVLAQRVERPLAERAHSDRVSPARDRNGCVALPSPLSPWVAPRSPRRSRRGSRTTCCSDSSATSGSTPRRRRTPRPIRARPSSSTFPAFSSPS